MQFERNLAIGLIFLAAAFAQTAEDGFRTRIAGVVYPALAEAARIQGDVHLSVESGEVKVRSGHPMLAGAAVETAKAFSSNESTTNLEVVFHFVIVDTTTSVRTMKTVRRGNPMERAVLRLFGRKAEKVVSQYRCEEGTAPPSDLKVAGAMIEIWIYGRDHCLQTEASTHLAEGRRHFSP